MTTPTTASFTVPAQQDSPAPHPPAHGESSGCRAVPLHHHASWSAEPPAWGLGTMLAHVGTATDPATGAITTPIHLSTAFGHPGLRESTGYDYTRTASPTRDVLQDALARLDAGTAAFALSSGMAAVQLAVETLAPYGGRVVALEDLYGGTYRYLQVLAEEGAYDVDFVIGEEGLRGALKNPASLVMIETPTPPGRGWWWTTPSTPRSSAGRWSGGPTSSSTRPRSTWAGTTTSWPAPSSWPTRSWANV